MNSVTLDVYTSVALVTLNRPNQLNALNSEVLNKLNEIFDSIDQESVRAVVITGSGEKAFAAGADISEMLAMNQLQARELSLLGNRTFTMIEEFPLPVIAAVNGYALGGGCELALSCDIRIASQNALFGQPETTLGITPGFGGTQRLAKIVNIGVAKEMIYTGKPVKAERALEIGLVNRIVEQNTLLDEAMKLAQLIAENGPVSMRLAKAAVNRGIDCSLAHCVELEAALFGSCFPTEDRKAAMKAFLEKKPKPEFRNR